MTQSKLHKLPPIAGLAAALLLILGTGAIATAQEKEKRDVKVEVTQSKEVIESESEIAGNEDELKIEFDNGSHNFNFEYESEDSGSDLEAKIKVELFDLIEWRDVNGNGRYDPNISEEAIQKIGLGDLTSSSVTTDSIAVGGINGVRVVGASAAPAKYSDLTMTLTLQMFGESLQFAGAPLEPTSMKFDIGIKGFPYQGNDTALALFAKVVMVAEDDAEVGEKDQLGIASRIGKYVSFFSWGSKVSVDGQEGTVGQTLLKEEKKSEVGKTELMSELYLLYPRGNIILHDPKLGVRLPQKAGGAGCSIF